MAPPAIDASRGARTILHALLQPTRERVEMAFRLALICALTTLVTEYYGTPEPALTAYLVFFLNRAERTTSLILNVALVVLLTVIIALVLLVAMAVVDAPGWRVVAMTLGSVMFLFLASASKLRPVGAILALIAGYALDLLGFVPFGELATRALLYAWLFIAIPAGVSLVVNLLFAPAPRRRAEQGIASRLRAAATMLNEPGEQDIGRFIHHRDAGVREVLEQLHLARVEHTLSEDGASRLKAAAYSTNVIVFLVDAIRRDGTVPREWRARAAATLAGMASAFEKQGYPIGIEPVAAAPDAATSESGTTLMGEFSDVLARYTASAMDAAKPEAAQTEAAKTGFFLPDAFSNPEHLRYALKTTAAAMFCYFLYVLLDWPGIHTCFITCYIVALSTTGETVEKLSLRIVGCLAGAAAGLAAIIWVIPAIDSIWGLLAVVFAGALCGGWVAAGQPRIAYAGFQFAFAFFLCVVQGTGPAFDLTIARDRVIGILIGNAVVYLVFTRLWPVSVSHRIERALASLLKEVAGLARLPLAARRAGLSGIQEHVAAIDDDLALLGYEPGTIRPSFEWSAARRAALRAVTRLEEPMVLDGESGFWMPLASRLDALAKQLARGGVARVDADAPTSSADEPLPRNGLQANACTQLLLLEKSLAAGT